MTTWFVGAASPSTRSTPPAQPTSAPRPSPTGPVRRLRANTWSRSLAGFLLLFALMGTWSLSTPLWGAPDEPAQAIRAAGAADGQIFGRPDPAVGPSSVSFSVPVALSGLIGTNTPCYGFENLVPASCQIDPVEASGRIRIATYVGRYPPLYYVIVGLPSRIFPDSPRQLYYMRLVSAALSALFFAAALVSAAQVRGRRWVVVGVAAAVTPMGIFLGSVVNPSGLEISSALCAWTSGLALFDGPEPRYHRRLLVWTAVSACVFVQLRGLSPLFLFVIAATLALLVGRRRVTAVLRRPDAQVGLAAVLVCGVFAVAWIESQHVLVSSTLPSPLLPGRGGALHQAIDRSLDVHSMIGLFGWLDTFLPLWVDRVWETVWWLLLGLAVLRRRWRTLAVGLALAVVVAVLPVALTLHERSRFGLVGEARYIIPLAVGLPVLAAYGAAGRRRIGGPGALAVLAGVGLAVSQVVAFLIMERRNRSGILGPVFTLHASWSPLLPWLAGVVAVTVLAVALLVWWLRLAADPAGSGTEALAAR